MRLRNILKNARVTQKLPFLLGNYKYEPLPSSTSIRLLELTSSADRTEVQCSLKTFELSNVPKFSALSYTWGDWQTPVPASQRSSLRGYSSRMPSSASRLKELAKSEADRRLERSVGIRRHPVICDGQLLKVTSNLRSALRVLVKSIATQQSHVMPRYYWIDSCCVDQQNIAERNSQVAKMADIFKAAQSVLVWLGKGDEFTQDAITTIETVSSIPEEKWPLVPYTAFYDCSSAEQTYRPGLSFHNWLGFIAMMNRPWFKRAWVVQEIALARSALIICGTRAFSWEKLSRTLSFIRATKWYHHLHTEKLKNIASLQQDPGLYKHVLHGKLDVGIGPIFLDSTRNKMAVSGRIGSVERPHHPTKPPLRMLLETHRFSKSSDPRDKVYAFLGLADKRLAPFRSFPKALVPDYNLSVQDVYTETAKSLLLSHGNLSLLSHVQDPSQTKIPDLPSWAPDWSVNLDPYPLRFRGPGYWKACGNRPWNINAFSLANGHLETQGYMLGFVNQTSLLLDEDPDPAASWASIVKLALSLDVPYPNPAKLPSTPSRIEVLWRTLTTNTYNKTYPAPPETGALFLDYVLNLQIHNRLMPWSSKDHFQPHHSPISDSIYPEWSTLLRLEPSESLYSWDKYRERLTAVVESIFDGSYSPIHLAQLQHEFDQSGGKRRRLFRTNTNFMGTGPISLKRDDEVWILQGGQVPFVLRRLSDGNCRLIGEAYVHGVMHAEVLAMELPRRHVTIE